MKRIKTLILILLLLAVTTGCTQDIVLHQPESEIVQIDLVYSPFGENQILYTIMGEDISGFLDNLQELRLYKHTSPQNIGGSFFVQIIYADDSTELLGTASVGYISNGVLEHDGWYYLSYDDLFTLFSEYTDLPE